MPCRQDILLRSKLEIVGLRLRASECLTDDVLQNVLVEKGLNNIPDVLTSFSIV
jgi:hypothetical protein